MGRTVRTGKFMMLIIARVLVPQNASDKSVFHNITSVEGTLKEFKDVNTLLEKYPVFPPFDLSDLEED